MILNSENLLKSAVIKSLREIQCESKKSRKSTKLWLLKLT